MSKTKARSVVERSYTTIQIEELSDGTFRASQRGLPDRGEGETPPAAVAELVAEIERGHYE